MVSDIENQSAAENCRRLARVLTLTKQMLVHGEEGEWEQVTALELERRDDMATCFSDAALVGDNELIAEAFATLLHINEELMAKVKIAREEVMVQGRELNRVRGAVNCYRDFEAEF